MAQFLIEAIALSGVGGSSAIVLGVGIAFLIPMFITVLPTSVSLWSIVMAFSFSMAVGCSSGSIPPARRRLQDPITALRYE